MEVQLRRLGPIFKTKVLKITDNCENKVWLAGRGTGCHIYTKSKYASRKHFSITYRENKYFISDLQSANGTFVNDEKVVGEKMLSLGNIISVGVPSTMQNTADCVIFVFELYSSMEIRLYGRENVNETENSSVSLIHSGNASVEPQIPHPQELKGDGEDEDEDIFIIEESLVKMKVKKEVGILSTSSSKSVKSQTVDENEDLHQNSIEIIEDSELNSNPVIDTENKISNVEETILNSFSNDKKPVEIVPTVPHESNRSVTNSCDRTEKEMCEVVTVEKPIIKSEIVDCVHMKDLSENSNKGLGVSESCFKKTEVETQEENEMKISTTTEVDLGVGVLDSNCSDFVMKDKGLDYDEENREGHDDEDVKAYEAPTQVDDLVVKDETNAADYSMTEELIEIRDSEEEEDKWFANLKKVQVNQSEEADEEDDDDVVFLEKIAKTSDADHNHYLIPNTCKVENDLTETDKKWLEKLLKIKQENSFSEVENLSQNLYSERSSDENEIEVNVRDEPNSPDNDDSCRETDTSQCVNKYNIRDCVVKLSKLPPEYLQEKLSTEVQKSATDVTSSKPVEDQSEISKEKAGEEIAELKKKVKFLEEREEKHEKAEEAKRNYNRKIGRAESQIRRRNREESRRHLQGSSGRRFQIRRDLANHKEQTRISNESAAPKKSGKSVKFDLVPKIKYFEIPVRLSPIDKGRLRFANIIYNICNWNTRWLEECRTVSREKDPPDLCSEPFKNVPKKFDYHTEYMSAFIPLMLLDLWNKIKDNWIEFGDAAFRQAVSCDFQEDYSARNLHVYHCTGLVQNIEAHKQLLREGQLVLLRLHQSRDAPSEKYSKKLGYLVFGFIERKTYERYEPHRTQVHSILESRCLAIQGPLYLARLIILAKKRPDFKIDKNEFIHLTVIQSISSELRMFRGICFLPESPLCRAILNPLKCNFPLRKPPKAVKICFKGPLDIFQKDLVSKMTYACITTSHFLYSVHGPAGTGKGQVIVAFILQLLYGEEFRNFERPKIIYCAPSSVPLDEVVTKLKVCRQSLEESTRFRLVRVGQMKEIKPDVREFSLSSLAQNMCSNEVKIGNKRKMAPDTSKLEGQILEEADVVCTTCSSSGMTKMISAFKKSLSRQGNRRVVCILDEAMQSKEYESVLPLLLGVTHLFLVGDVYQLDPPSSGEKTRLLGLDMSLFWRIFQNFGKTPQPLSPFYVLRVQHRMNPSISKFPSTAFYQYKMENSNRNFTHTISNLRNYLFLLDQCQEEPPEKENREGRVVLQLIKTITKVTRSFSRAIDIAVITCDLRQNDTFQSFVPKSKFPEVEINQVHRFQGREADIVVFTYDGSKMPNSQVAVALTRAKCSLFVLASQKSIGKSSWFQKLKTDAEARNVFKIVPPSPTPDLLEPILTT